MIVVVYFVIINFIAFSMYGMDKRKAIKNQWRISEKALLFVAFVGGGIGAFLGMNIFRHKTKHWKFRILVPLFIILNMAMFYVIYENIL